MALGRAAGFEAPATALIGMPDGMPPALVVERFDIRENRADKRMVIAHPPPWQRDLGFRVAAR
jgi:serine/threonine-protein kinase HipA